MPKNLVICCDGTGNEVRLTTSNVLKLFRVVTRNEQQRVYYHPGVGTIGQQDAWQRLRQRVRGAFGMATGYGLDEDVLGAYRFLCQHYEKGDKIWLFGFSRGAYTVRVLAALLHVIGLLGRDQINLAGYALAAYKRTSDVISDGELSAPGNNRVPDAGKADRSALAQAWHFGRVTFARPVRIEFIGVWDTVASVIVPRRDRLLPTLQTLRHTRTNSSVRCFRQAMAIDERRRMFRLNRWIDEQDFRPNPYKPAVKEAQDIKQVWFAGVHADIGGGYPELESGLSKFPLKWMIDEARQRGLQFNPGMVNHLVDGRRRSGSRHDYVPPNAAACLHDSLTHWWKPIEWLPKSVRFREWKDDRKTWLGCYLPRGEPRAIPERAMVHHSVELRRQQRPDYQPVNLPQRYQVV